MLAVLAPTQPNAILQGNKQIFARFFSANAHLGGPPLSHWARGLSLGANVRRDNNGSCDGLLCSRRRPGFPRGRGIGWERAKNPSIHLPSELSARRFALLAEQRHSLSSRCLLK